MKRTTLTGLAMMVAVPILPRFLDLSLARSTLVCACVAGAWLAGVWASGGDLVDQVVEETRRGRR